MTLFADIVAHSGTQILQRPPGNGSGHAPAATGRPAPPVRTIEFEVGTPLADLERRALLATLDHCAGNKRRCAELCGVSLKTLYNRLAAYREAGAEETAR